MNNFLSQPLPDIGSINNTQAICESFTFMDIGKKLSKYIFCTKHSLTYLGIFNSFVFFIQTNRNLEIINKACE